MPVITPLAAVLVLLLAIVHTGCRGQWGPHPRRMEFGPLATADRIEVSYEGITPYTTVGDRRRIEEAGRFIADRQDGFIDLWSGPAVPRLILDFYQGDRHIGGFGIGESYVTAGSVSRPVPAAEIAAFAARMQFTWPPDR